MFIFVLLSCFGVSLFGQTQVASLRPHQELRWQRISPSAERPDGPVLYQLVFRFVAHDGTLIGTGSMSQPLAIAPGGVGTTQLATGAVMGSTIASGQVVKSLNGVFDTVTLSAGTGIAITPNGQTLTIANTAPATPAWGLTGTSGTGCTTTPCADFIGTTDSASLEFQVSNNRALRIEPATDGSGQNLGFSPNVIGGFSGNVVSGAGVAGTTIAGGGANSQVNTVTASFGSVGGGAGNTSGAIFSTVAGGYQSTASGNFSAVAGGSSNIASGYGSLVAGGIGNTASSSLSTVAGGSSNTASGFRSIVVGGDHNTASGTNSFAAGNKANAAHNLSFVWCDGESSPCTTSGAQQFVVVAQGGVAMYSDAGITFRGGSQFCSLSGSSGGWNCSSDRNLKRGFQPVAGRNILQLVAQLPISTWSFQSDTSGARHLGPMAQDFYAAFHLGDDDQAIGTTDAQGVALAAIQGLNQKLEDELRKKDAEIAALQKQMEALTLHLAAVEKASLRATQLARE